MDIKDERPPYVTFTREAKEDVLASRAQGHYVAKDVDFVHVTPAYTRDIFDQRVDVWFASKERDVEAGRFRKEWLDHYKSQYAAWKQGQSLPLKGIPIRGWGVISPAQQETLIRMNILTVEDLSLVNQDGMRMIGPNSLELKNKAIAWLGELKDKGANTMEIAALRGENETLKASLEKLQSQVGALLSQKAVPGPETGAIGAADILDDAPDFDPRAAYERKFGKAPHHRMKPETIEAALKD